MRVLAVLPNLEIGESIYGWCAHAHQLSCNLSSARTSQALLGVPHASRQLDVPSNLMALAHLGSLEYLLRFHTVAGAYLPFFPRLQQDRILALSTRCAPFWIRAALQCSRSYPIDHPLRLCTACMTDDQSVLGRPLWHIDHQLPGACCCALHGERLAHVRISGKRFLTPDQGLDSAKTIRCDVKAGLICAAIGRIAKSFTTTRAEHLTDAILQRMVEIGVAHSLKRIEHRRLEIWFRNSPMGQMCRTVGSGLASLADGRWIAGHLWRHHHSNAARWIVLWSALEWENRVEAEYAFTCACTGRSIDRDGQAGLWMHGNPRRAPQKVRLALATSPTYADAIHHLNCSRSDLVRWLEMDPGLREEWRQRREAKRLTEILERIHRGETYTPERSVRDEPDIRWLRQNYPSIYAQTGLMRTTQESLFK